MASIFSVSEKSIENCLLGELACAHLADLPTLSRFPLPSQHPTGHPLLPATPVLDITSRPCSPWILRTLFARNPFNSDSVVGKQIPPQVISPHWGLSSQHVTGHPLPPATPVLDITSRTCSPWILYTLFARNPSSSDSVVSKQIPPRAIFPHWGTFPLHPTSHPLPPVTSVLDITSRTCSPWILF